MIASGVSASRAATSAPVLGLLGLCAALLAAIAWALYGAEPASDGTSSADRALAGAGLVLGVIVAALAFRLASAARGARAQPARGGILAPAVASDVRNALGALATNAEVLRLVDASHSFEPSHHRAIDAMGRQVVYLTSLLGGMLGEHAAPPARHRAAPAPSTQERTPEHPARVVLVDDNTDGLEALATLLVSWGHEVRTAVDGPSGLALIRDVHPDVALLDIELPGIDGYTLAHEIRSSGELDGVELVALTGLGPPHDRRTAIAAGFDLHLSKPVDLPSLRRLLGAPAPGGETGKGRVG